MTVSAKDAPSVAHRAMDALPIAVLSVGPRDAISFLNPAAEQIIGRSGALLRGRPISEVVGADSPLLDFVLRVRREGGVVYSRCVRLSGPQMPPIEADLSAAYEVDADTVVLTLSICRTPKEDNSGEVAAVAQVARMLGHEVKNPLAGIVGAAQLLARQARDDQQALLTLIREEGARIERIVDRFAAFETFFSPKPRSTNVHAVLDSVVQLVRASIGAETLFDLQYDPSLPEIQVDPDHLHEACLNLVKNAVEAAQKTRKARVSVFTRYRAGFRFAGRDVARARGALEIAVQDNGPGVPESTAPHVFEPFFTTKAGGAGVGLAVVSEIMSAHGGFVILDNAAAGGACFRLLFPMSPALSMTGNNGANGK